MASPVHPTNLPVPPAPPLPPVQQTMERSEAPTSKELATVAPDPVARLFGACLRGDAAGVTASLAAGADCDARDHSHWTPLLRAADGGHAACVAALLAGGADPTRTSPWEWTPLHAAARAGSQRCVAALLAAGASLLARDKGHWVALHACADAGHSGPALRSLLSAAPEAALARDADGRTPLALALRGCHAEAAQLLRQAAPLPPVREVLAALSRARARSLGETVLDGWIWGLYPALAARQRLTAAEWARLPEPCPGIGAALPAVLQRSPAEAALLCRHLPRSVRQRLRCAAQCLARAHAQAGVQLPAPIVGHVLALSAAE